MSRVSFYSALMLCLLAHSIMVGKLTPANAQTQQFGGLTLGVGLSLTHDLGKNDRIIKADVVGGVVRVTEEKNDLARIMLELHYFFTPLIQPLDKTWWGHGPFVAIAPGTTEKVIDAIGVGWMVGFRNRIWDAEKRAYTGWAATSWNFGIGFVVDANSKILGDGIRANQPLPPGETAPVRLKDTSQGGLMFITSFSF